MPTSLSDPNKGSKGDKEGGDSPAPGEGDGIVSIDDIMEEVGEEPLPESDGKLKMRALF